MFMVNPSPPCANEHARDVGRIRIERLILGAACVFSMSLARPVLADASPRASGPASGIVTAMPCAASASDTPGDLLDPTYALAPRRTPYDSPDPLLDPIDDDDDDEDGRERFRSQSHDGNLELAFRMRRQSHAWIRPLTPDTGLLPHVFLIDSVRRL
jgi:hypothetical protein